MHLGEVDWNVSEQGEVQAVKPYYWICTLVAMVMPVPGGSQDNIAPLHIHLLTFYGSEAFGSFDDESHGKSYVAVCGRNFVGKNQLQASVDGICCVWCIYIHVSSALVRLVDRF